MILSHTLYFITGWSFSLTTRTRAPSSGQFIIASGPRLNRAPFSYAGFGKTRGNKYRINGDLEGRGKETVSLNLASSLTSSLYNKLD